MPAKFEMNPVVGEAALATFAGLAVSADPLRPVQIGGNALAQGALTALARAEGLATAAILKHPPRTEFPITIGWARARIDEAPPEIKTLYLAAYGAVRAVSDATKGIPGAASVPPLGFVPVAVYFVVVGVAAIVAGAWWAAEKSRAMVQCEAHKVIELARIDGAAKLAQADIQKNGQISPETARIIGQTFAPQAMAETTSGLMSYVKTGATAAGAVAVLGGVAWLAMERPWERARA